MRKLIVLIILMLSISMLTACSSAETQTVVPASVTEPPEIPTEALQTASLEDILDITWQWADLVETDPASQSVVPNPENYIIVFRSDGTVEIQADCNMVLGSFSMEGDILNIELGLSTMAYCGDDSLDQQHLSFLEQVSSYGMEAGRLKLAGEPFNMGFNNGGPAEEPEEPEIMTCNAGIDSASVTLDTKGLPYSYQPNCVPGTPYDNSQPPGPTGLPDHIQVNFGVEGQQDVLPNDPIIYIIPIEAYKQLWEQNNDPTVINAYESLVALLQARPDPIPTVGMPVVPIEEVTGVNDLVTQYAYVDTTTGFGVRFVGRFSQGPNPVSNDNPQLFYIYQGLSDDGVYLITFFYPVATGALPNSEDVSEDEQQQADTDPQGYLDAKVTELNALTPADWEPNLTTLDAVITSLEYPVAAVGPAITDITWLWTELIQADGQSIVADPENYTLLLLADGSFSIVADCNSGSGAYTLDGSSLSLEIGPVTTAICSEESLSDFYIHLLSQVGSYEISEGYLGLNLKDSAGRMGYYLSVPIEDDPELSPDDPTAVAIDIINVRSGPGTNYPSYGLASPGAKARVIGISEDGGWWVVKISTSVATDGRGWVSADYVEVTNGDDVPVIPTPPLPEPY